VEGSEVSIVKLGRLQDQRYRLGCPGDAASVHHLLINVSILFPRENAIVHLLFSSSANFAKASTALCEVNIMPPYFASLCFPILFSASNFLTVLNPSPKNLCSSTGTKIGSNCVPFLAAENFSSYPSLGMDFVFSNKIGMAPLGPVEIVLMVVTF
jgi:hypothetical protein